MHEYEQENLKGKFIVEWQDAQPIDSPRFRYNGFQPGTSILPAGWKMAENTLPLFCDIRYDRDVAITLRDGTVIYADIYRPVSEEKVPVLFASTMFGKYGSYVNIDDIPGRNGIPEGALSGLQTWEAPDPAWWVNQGYAIANVDIRGVGSSEGNGCYFGSQDRDDNYDIIEFLGTQSWANGKVAMVGNSWLAITQWYVASLNPPHLAAIAPWEGHANMYRDEYMRGGIPNFSFARPCMSYGKNKMEDLQSMMRKYPLMNAYWHDKEADYESCLVPAYVVASYSSEIHANGTFEGFRRIGSAEKWLRIHNTQEWPDLYDEQNSQDLCRFFDHYLKGIDNGWETTPRVRMAILDPSGVGTLKISYEPPVGVGPSYYTQAYSGQRFHYPTPNIEVAQKSAKAELNRAEESFPLARQQLKRLYLNAETMTMQTECPAKRFDCSYISDNYEDHVTFKYVFDKDTEISGYMKLHVWMMTKEADDMDVYVRISKLNSKGESVFHHARMWEYSGPNGMLRASHRELDPQRSTETEPFHTHDSLLPITRGKPVALEIGLWPTSMLFHAGEAIEVNIAGFDYYGITGAWDDAITFNRGLQFVCTGGEYDSYLVIPEIPEKE